MTTLLITHLLWSLVCYLLVTVAISEQMKTEHKILCFIPYLNTVFLSLVVVLKIVNTGHYLKQLLTFVSVVKTIVIGK